MFHTVRSSVFGIERTFLVSDRALIVIAATGRRVDVPFQEIREVRLQYAGTTSYRCVIVTDSQRFVVTNRHYVRYCGRETRDESYTGFLARLHEKLQPFAPHIRFTRSPKLPSRMAAVMFVLLPVLYVVCLAGFSHSLMSHVCVVYAVVFIAPGTLLGMILSLMQWIRSRSYSPRELPVEFLPVQETGDESRVRRRRDVVFSAIVNRSVKSTKSQAHSVSRPPEQPFALPFSEMSNS